MRYKILFVEDESILGQLVAEALVKKGYEVKHISNGAEGLKAYRIFQPHLCLFDIMLPGKDGYELTRQIRAIDKNIPIIFLTAKIQIHDLVEGFNAGCNDYIRKPFSIDEVYMRISGWLAEKYSVSDDTIPLTCNIDNYIFDTRQETLQTPEGVIQLTHKEAIILQLLYIHRNNIISRDFLMQKVWGNGTMQNSRTLDVYINKLRKHMGDNPNRILTLKGIRYRFICD
ncbi:MAG: response regulator transcription factor [Taibaiella sp.]|nr:response regulator transcription factor [Taibaiella sp.]